MDVHTFRELLLRCFNGHIPTKVMVALSGGVDSMCLTYLLSQYKQNYNQNLQVYATTIDHGYRADSGAEALKVGQIVEKWGVNHTVSRLTYDRDVSCITNFEEVARHLRYSVLRQNCNDLGIEALLVGHNLNDRLETFLQRLEMHSTVYGLGGLKPKAQFPGPESPDSSLFLYRPLLSLEKQQLQKTCKDAGIVWFEDKTNADRALTPRNMFRYLINEYIPQQANPELAVLSKSALIETVQLIDKTINVLQTKVAALDEYATQYGGLLIDPKCATISFTVPSDFWQKLHPLVAGRWIYDTIYPISSAKHFHWSYAKIERQAIPSIRKFVTGHGLDFTATYLNVVFRIRKENGILCFNISKQPPIRSDISLLHQAVVANTFSQPFLYDRTWWIRIQHPSERKVKIFPYTLHYRKQIKEAFPHLQKLPPGNSTVPVIGDASGILALPTYGLARNITVECSLKKRSSI